MHYTQVEQGRIFALRLEEKDELPDDIEELARKENISSALVFFLGGADSDSRVVVGPAENNQEEIKPQVNSLPGISEAVGFGTIFPDEEGAPKLHLHAAFGRGDKTLTGCTRRGVSIWMIGEVVVMELLGHDSARITDPETGFELLDLK